MVRLDPTATGAVFTVYPSLCRSYPPSDAACYMHGAEVMDTYGAEGATLDGQVVVLLLLVLKHNDTWTAHMDNKASCRK